MIESPKTLPPWLVINVLEHGAKAYKTYEYILNKGYYKLRYRGWTRSIPVRDEIEMMSNYHSIPFLIPTQSIMVSSETHTVWYFDTEQEACDFVTCMLQLEM